MYKGVIVSQQFRRSGGFMGSQNPRILIVDDEPLIVKLLTQHLEAEGFAVLTATDGREGLVKARTESPHLILLDLILPKLNGYEVCTMLKQDTRYQGIPIVMLTAKANEKDEQLGKTCGADLYLHKPVQAQALLGHLRALLSFPEPSPPSQP